MEQRHPLSGLRVLEMGSRTTPPTSANSLTDAGADVLKLESPVGTRSDMVSVRRLHP